MIDYLALFVEVDDWVWYHWAQYVFAWCLLIALIRDYRS